MRTKEEIKSLVSKCTTLYELDDLVGQTTLEEFCAYHYEFLFGAYLIGIEIGGDSAEEFVKDELDYIRKWRDKHDSPSVGELLRKETIEKEHTSK